MACVVWLLGRIAIVHSRCCRQMQVLHEWLGWALEVLQFQQRTRFHASSSHIPIRGRPPFGVPKFSHNPTHPSDLAMYLLLAFSPQPWSSCLTPTTAPFLTLAPLSGDLRQYLVIASGQQITVGRGGQETTKYLARSLWILVLL
jgi:hypothetical protein